MLNNRSKQTVIVEAGFFNKAKATFTVEPATQGVVMVNSELKCTDLIPPGLGVAYMNLIGGKSHGGWVFDASANMLRAKGDTSASAIGRIGLAPNGKLLILFNNHKPDANQFIVQINDAGRNISRQFGSMD